MKYLSYEEVKDFPNIIVDGYGTRNTLLTLSHWPGSQTPADLLADTSCEIVFNFLENKNTRHAVHAEEAKAVSNNHFDEDGLCGIFTLIHPGKALENKDLIIDIATAGDFGVYRDIQAARIVFILQAYSQKKTSPLGGSVFLRGYAKECEVLYKKLLHLFPDFLDNTVKYEQYYLEEEKILRESEKKINSKKIKTELFPEIDLCVFYLNDDESLHPMAVNTFTESNRIVFLYPSSLRLLYRYESWVRYHSRKIPPRMDLSPLAEKWNREESSGKWKFDGVNEITPELYFSREKSDILSSRLLDDLISFLKNN